MPCGVSGGRVRARERMKREANILLGTVFCLLALGVVMVYSSSATVASEAAKFGSDPCFFLKRQALWVAVSLVVLLVFANIDYHRWQRLAFPLLVLSAGLLVLVLVPSIGRCANGARRWLTVGPFNFQPSEMAKVAVLLYAAAYASAGPERFASFWRGFLPGFTALGLVCALVICEPDVGTALFLGGVGTAVFLVGGARWRHVFGLGGAAVGAASVLFISKLDYVQHRVAVYLDPTLDPLGKGHHLLQSEIALGSGGLFGVGLGQSQLKLFFLPERHTDFIFAIIGEELGFVGAAAVVCAYVLLLVCGWRICRRAPDRLGLLLSAGALLSIIAQAAVNMAVVTGLLPTKGIALPFVSYGGSALVAAAAAAGMILNVARAAGAAPEDPEPAAEYPAALDPLMPAEA
jgi:cell division protein FtsW